MFGNIKLFNRMASAFGFHGLRSVWVSIDELRHSHRVGWNLKREPALQLQSLPENVCLGAFLEGARPWPVHTVLALPGAF